VINKLLKDLMDSKLVSRLAHRVPTLTHKLDLTKVEVIYLPIYINVFTTNYSIDP